MSKKKEIKKLENRVRGLEYWINDVEHEKFIEVQDALEDIQRDVLCHEERIDELFDMMNEFLPKIIELNSSNQELISDLTKIANRHTEDLKQLHQIVSMLNRTDEYVFKIATNAKEL